MLKTKSFTFTTSSSSSFSSFFFYFLFCWHLCFRRCWCTSFTSNFLKNKNKNTNIIPSLTCLIWSISTKFIQKKQRTCIFYYFFYNIPSRLDIICWFKWLKAMLLSTEEKYFYSFLFSGPEFFIFCSPPPRRHSKNLKKAKNTAKLSFLGHFLFFRSLFLFLIEDIEFAKEDFQEARSTPNIAQKNLEAHKKIFWIKK